MQNQLLSVVGNLLTTAASGKQAGKIESRTTRVGADEFKCQIYVPPTAGGAEKLPLLIFLHGIRERGSGGLLPAGVASAVALNYFAQVPAIVLLPQCRQGSFWSDLVMDEMVMNALRQTIEEFGADEKRVSLIGVSMGGYGVWSFAKNHPGKFAALVAICGGSPILNGERFIPIAERVGATPTRIFHGADDTIVPVAESRQMAAALAAHGGNVEYKEYPNVGHHVWLNVLGEKDLLPWLVAQHL